MGFNSFFKILPVIFSRGIHNSNASLREIDYILYAGKFSQFIFNSPCAADTGHADDFYCFLNSILSPTIHKFGDEFIHSGLSAE